MSQQQPTFKQSVESFWDWFTSVHEHFYQEIEAQRCSDLEPETTKMVSKFLPGFAWVYGPGPEEFGGHSFTLTGEGVIHQQLLSAYWLERAPALPGWTFYASRQPDAFQGGGCFIIDEKRFEFEALWVSPTIDDAREKVDIAAWHPLFGEIPEERFRALYLMLDEVLGEYEVESYLGAIEVSDTQLANAMPLAELPEFLEETWKNKGWKLLSPIDATSLYQFNESPGEFLRGDTFSGITRNLSLIRDYFGGDGQMEDPLEGNGAEFVFVAFDSKILPEGKEVGFRGEIEDAIDQCLREHAAGGVIGGACGTDQSYVDVLIVDGDTSLSWIQEVLRARGLPAGTGIHFFAKGNEGRRVFLA